MTDLNASMMTDNMNMTAIYSTSREIEPVEILMVLSINWCTCEVNSYDPCSIPCDKTSRMISVDMYEILLVLWEQDNKV